MNISTSYKVSYSPADQAQPKPKSVMDKVAEHYTETPLDAVFFGVEGAYTAASALGGGTLDGLFDVAAGGLGAINMGLGAWQLAKSRGKTGESKKAAQMEAAGSFLRGFGMISACAGVGGASLAIYAVGAAASVYAEGM